MMRMSHHSDSSAIRLGVVGAGGQCTRALMPGLHTIPEIELVAICDLQEALARRNARDFGAPSVYTDHEAMLAQETLDAVLVVGPPVIHESIGLDVLSSGRHLFIEKPAAPTVEGARKLAQTALDHGRFGQVGHMMRHADPVRVARDFMRQESFGRLLAVESKYTTWPTAARPNNEGWGCPDEDWAYMLIQGGHPIDLLRSFLGPIRKVSAFRAHGAGSCKIYHAIVEDENGVTGFLNLQDSFNGWTTGLELIGDGKSMVRVDDLGRVSYRAGEKRTEAENDARGNTTWLWEPHHTTPHWQRTGYGNQLRAFAQSILENRSPEPSLLDGWQNLVIAEQILESIRTGRTIDLPNEALTLQPLATR